MTLTQTINSNNQFYDIGKTKCLRVLITVLVNKYFHIKWDMEKYIKSSLKIIESSADSYDICTAYHSIYVDFGKIIYGMI